MCCIAPSLGVFEEAVEFALESVDEHSGKLWHRDLVSDFLLGLHCRHGE